MQEIQRIIFPHNFFNCPKEMYLRYEDEKVIAFPEENKLTFFEGGQIKANTFFNAFSPEKWLLNTSLDNLHLRIQGQGEFVLRFCQQSFGVSKQVILEKTLSLNDTETIAIPDFNRIPAGIAFFELQALKPSELHRIAYVTDNPPVNDIKLGIVITHFNRKQQVQQAVKRIKDQLLSDPLYRNKISVTVIDNSKNSGITDPEITVIENRNLGGSGGFTKGLMHLLNTPGITHCLFMDDDASCEIESIRRTFQLLSYATTPSTAIIGALIRELEPNRLFEKGATFNGTCRPLKNGLDLLKTDNIIESEFDTFSPDYGGWWFFSFPLKNIQHLPFPFFVRGDDVSFSLANKFNLVTMNGIASFGDDFSLKNSPLSVYLDLRSHLVEQIYFLEHKRLPLIRNTARFLLTALFSYNYGTARAICQATRDFMEGPDFFAANMDMQRIFEKNRHWSKNETLTSINRLDKNIYYEQKKESVFRKIIRVATLNGNLLPDFLLKKDKMVFQQKGFRATFREVFLYKEIYYEYTPHMKGYIAKRSQREFFSILLDYLIIILTLNKNFNAIKSLYRNKMPYFMTKEFWNNVYKET